MIVLKAKAESSSASPINLATPNEKSEKTSSMSFSELLRGKDVKLQTDDNAQSSKKGTVVLAIDDKEIILPKTSGDAKVVPDIKSSDLLDEELELLELNPKVTEKLSVKELKTLISDAKNYLREQIVNSDGYKNAQIKELPQTLKGLAQLAKKLDINISKITIEQVKPIQTKSSSIEINTTDDDLDEPKKLSIDKKAPKLSKVSSQNIDENVDIQKDVKQDVKFNSKNDLKISDIAKVSQTPLFKAQSKVEVTSTEQVVQVKQSIAQPVKTPKDRADETLKLLLRGEKPTHSKANMTADFSVATAKVIAPKATSDASNSLEALLRGDNGSQNTDVKTEQIATHKADSFEVKVNEAKQMIKYLSTDVKQAIDDYKSPFTRVKVQLNPQQLGNVELTVIQRGKNLHVNLSSNNVAVNALSANLNELKVQLNNNGINNATFNFNSSSENGSSSNEQQQRHQEQKNANEEYGYFENEEQHVEVLSSLEIVVPSYA